MSLILFTCHSVKRLKRVRLDLDLSPERFGFQAPARYCVSCLLLVPVAVKLLDQVVSYCMDVQLLIS